MRIQLDKEKKETQRIRKTQISVENKKFEELLLQKQKDYQTEDRQDHVKMIKIDNDLGSTFKDK